MAMTLDEEWCAMFSLGQDTKHDKPLADSCRDATRSVSLCQSGHCGSANVDERGLPLKCLSFQSDSGARRAILLTV